MPGQCRWTSRSSITAGLRASCALTLEIPSRILYSAEEGVFKPAQTHRRSACSARRNCRSPRGPQPAQIADSSRAALVGVQEVNCVHITHSGPIMSWLAPLCLLARASALRSARRPTAAGPVANVLRGLHEASLLREELES
jgi:hypothetical protein